MPCLVRNPTVGGSFTCTRLLLSFRKSLGQYAHATSRLCTAPFDKGACTDDSPLRSVPGVLHPGCMAALQAEHFLVAQEELTDRTAPRATEGDDPTAPNGIAPDTSAATMELPAKAVDSNAHVPVAY